MGAVSEIEHQVVSSLDISARLRVPVDMFMRETPEWLLRLRAVSVVQERKNHSLNGYIPVRIVVSAPSSEIYSLHFCGDILNQMVSSMRQRL